jgi:putative endopeptidase
MFTLLDDLSRQRTREILDGVKDDPASKIGNAYSAYLDEEAIEARGLAPIEPWLAQVRGLKAKSGYAALAAAADRNGIPGPFGGYVGQDDKAPERYAYTVYQAGLGMPDRDYYLSQDAKLAETRAAYLKHLTNVLTLAGEPDAAARAAAILAFETDIARAHWTQVESRDATRIYNKMTLAALARSAPGFDFAAYARGVGADVDDLIVNQPSAMKGIAAAIGRTPLQVLKDQLLVRSLDNYSDYLPKRFDQEAFSFYGTVLSGTPEQEPRWKRGVTFVTTRSATRSARSTSSATFPRRPRRRPTSWSATSSPRWTGASTGSNGWRRRPGPRPTPSSPPSRPRSAIPTAGAISRGSKSAATIRSATRCARPISSISTMSANWASPSTAGSGA